MIEKLQKIYEHFGEREQLEKKLPDFQELLLKHPIIHARTKDNIMLPEAVVHELGVTGIGMRSATGVAYDLRKVKPLQKKRSGL
jgi:NADH-quinone oxidoreductase subunit D